MAWIAAVYMLEQKAIVAVINTTMMVLSPEEAPCQRIWIRR